MHIEKLKYPIGKCVIPKNITEDHINKWIDSIASFPINVSKEINNLTPTELQYKYRPKGWNIKQVVAHCLDSHINSFIRFKLALTEDNPVIKPYNETEWANLEDTLTYPINDIVIELSYLHRRWVFLLKSMDKKDFNKTFIHPENNNVINLKENLCIYAWHCTHHLYHIINAKKYKF